MTPRPVLYVHHRPELGGAPQSLFYLLQTLDRERYEPYVYCPPGPAAELFRREATVYTGAVSGFTHIWASTYSGRRWLLLARELAQLPKHVIDFRRTVARRDFALVHLNDSPLLAAAYLARHAGRPVVWHLRSALPAEGTGDRRSQFVRSAIRRFADRSIAINDNVADSFDVGSAVVPNPVDLQRFRPGDVRAARAQLGLPVDEPVVSFFGFIYPSKGFREFIQAAALARAAGVRARYLIVGGDVRGEAFFRTPFGRTLQRLDLARNHEHEAKRYVRSLGLEDAVRFVAFTADTPLLYQATDVVVAPSRGPELGRPVLEASACGRAIVASGSRDGAGLVLPSETGFLVPRRSPDAIAAALVRLLRDEGLRLRLGANARRHAEANFDPQRNGRRVMDLYDEVLARA
jgi:glycosyltransferase involved in cell wall biosynthesis